MKIYKKISKNLFRFKDQYKLLKKLKINSKICKRLIKKVNDYLTKVEAAELLKNEGNQFFKDKNY